MKCFVSEVEEYLASLGGCPEGVRVVPVPLSYFVSCSDSAYIDQAAEALLEVRRTNIAAGIKETIFLYEDQWRCRPELIRRRLRSHLGKGESIFARNCDVRDIPQETAAEFLNRNHIYGATKSPYRYGLFRRRSTGAAEAGMPDTASLVAVATFSARNEWERYASLPQLRVCGGMGKILKHFIRSVRPREVMSYVDLEWGNGDVYLHIGFHNKKCTSPVHFLINPETFERIHIRKFGRDRRFRSIRHDFWPEMANPGSMCMLLDVEQLRESCHIEDLPDSRSHVQYGEGAAAALDALEKCKHHTES